MGDPEEIQKATKLLLEAEAPLIISGREVASSRSIHNLVELAELLAIPVVAEPHLQLISLNFPNNHTLYFNTFDSESNLVKTSDLILALGCKLFTEFNPPIKNIFGETKKIIQINVDPWEIAKNYPVDIGIFLMWEQPYGT